MRYGIPDAYIEPMFCKLICQMRVKNWITCVQDRGKWKDVVEKAITFNQQGSSAPEEEDEEVL